MAEDRIDPEMLALFRKESAEQLETLEQALLRLEQQPGDEDALDTARRQMHNLKGASRILGLQPIEELAHTSEDLLEGATEEGGLEPDETEALFGSLDALRRLADAATVEGLEAEEVPVDEVVEELAPTDRPAEEAGPVAHEPPALDEQQPAGEADQQPAASISDPLERAEAHRIETIRVDPEHLDMLLRRAGELSATVRRLGAIGSRLDQGLDVLAEIDELVRNELPSATEASVARALRRDIDQLEETVEEAADEIEADTSRLGTLAETIEDGIKESRLVPMSTTFNLFSRAVRDLARAEDKRVDLEIEGEEVRADKQVLEELKGPLMHLVRNAVDHGIEPPGERRQAGKDPAGKVRLSARRTSESILVEVEDDGRGIDPDEIRRRARERELLSDAELANLDDGEILDLVFGAGFTTRERVSELSGRGIGLETVTKTAEQLQGTVSIDSALGEGTRVRMELPVELSTVHVVLSCMGPHTFGIPIEAVSRVTTVDADDVEQASGEVTADKDGAPVPVADIGHALAIREPPADLFAEGSRPCVIIRDGPQRLGILVDQIVGETEVVANPLGPVLRNVRSVSGASVLPDGEICIILDPADLSEDVQRAGSLVPEAGGGDRQRLRRLLLVEDTQVTRQQLRRTLETAGWDVLVAQDGEAAIERLAEENVDVVVTDILMPSLDGLDLTRRIREDPELSGLPVVLVSTRGAEKEADEAMEAGADAFVTKDPLEPTRLLDALEDLA